MTPMNSGHTGLIPAGTKDTQSLSRKKLVGKPSVIVFKNDKLNERYLSEEYKLLESLLPMGPVKSHFKKYNEKGYIYIKYSRASPYLFKCISSYLRECTRNMFNLIYYVPFRNLAKYINIHDENCRACVKWRLMLNK